MADPTLDVDGELLEEAALRPLRKAGPGYYFLILGFLAVIGFGLFAYSIQLRGAASPGTTYNVYAWYTNTSGTTTKKSGTKAIIAGGSATLDFTTF